MTNFERSCFFNDKSEDIEFIQNLSPFGIADFAESAAL